MLTKPTYQQKLIDSGFDASLDATSDKFCTRLEADIAFWTLVVRTLGIKVE